MISEGRIARMGVRKIHTLWL